MTTPTVIFATTIAGSIDSFNQTEYTANLAAFLAVEQSAITLDVSSGSILVTAYIAAESANVAGRVEGVLRSASTAQLTASLQVAVETVAVSTVAPAGSAQLGAPSPPMDATLTVGPSNSALTGNEASNPVNSSGLVTMVVAVTCGLVGYALAMLLCVRLYRRGCKPLPSSVGTRAVGVRTLNEDPPPRTSPDAPKAAAAHQTDSSPSTNNGSPPNKDEEQAQHKSPNAFQQQLTWLERQPVDTPSEQGDSQRLQSPIPSIAIDLAAEAAKEEVALAEVKVVEERSFGSYLRVWT